MKFPIMLRRTHEAIVEDLRESYNKSVFTLVDQLDHRDYLLGQRERKIMELKAELEQARKNDTPRDPETGRFVKVERVPNLSGSNEEALADMKRLAELEAADDQ